MNKPIKVIRRNDETGVFQLLELVERNGKLVWEELRRMTKGQAKSWAKVYGIPITY